MPTPRLDPPGSAPIPLSVALEFQRGITAVDLASVSGADGLFAQLTHAGWMAEVDGAWTRYRESKPLDDSGGLKHGIKTDLMGDFRTIRNDVRKHEAVARDGTDKCRVLKWFEKGDAIALMPGHVIDFLHRLGVWYGHDMILVPNGDWV